MAGNLNPGPIDPSLLHLNHDHRATFLFNGSINSTNTMTVRRGDEKFWIAVRTTYIHDRVRHFIGVAGFGPFFSIGNRRIDNALVTALVERWRPETHTFHFPRIGEATVTLQDVQVLWGFRVTGGAVTGMDVKLSIDQWRKECEELLRFLPLSSDIKKGSIIMSALLKEINKELSSNDSDDVYMKRARVFILHMIGGCLFTNTSGNRVPLCYLQNIKDLESSGQLSWGSAILGYLYRRLCKATKPGKSDTCRPMGLLQLWAWTRISSLAPTVTNTHYNFGTEPYGGRFGDEHAERNFGRVTSHVLPACRSQLTALTTHEFNWVPYENILQQLPAYCSIDSENWRCETYLVCWEIVEPHPVTRVMRQFRMFQDVPGPPLFSENDCKVLHAVSRSGRFNHSWADEHIDYINAWNGRFANLQISHYVNDFSPSHEYIAWFHPRTVFYITNPGSTSQGFQPLGEQREFLMDGMTRWHQGDENLSQQYMGQINSDDRFSHLPSHYTDHYVPVPQQMFQRDAPRRRAQPRSNVDEAGPSNPEPSHGVNFDTSMYYPTHDSMPFQSQDPDPFEFPNQSYTPSGGFLSLFDYTPTPTPEVYNYNYLTSPPAMQHRGGESSHQNRDVSPVHYQGFDFDNEDGNRRYPQREHQPPDCYTPSDPNPQVHRGRRRR